MSGSAQATLIARTQASVSSGAMQLQPTATAPARSRMRAHSAASGASGPTKLMHTKTGRSQAVCAASSAARASSSEVKVSSRIASGAAADKAAACSRYCSRALAYPTAGPCACAAAAASSQDARASSAAKPLPGSTCTPHGPMAASTWGKPASRARRTPSMLMAPTWPARPSDAKHELVAQNVLVTAQSAPAMR